KFKKHPKAKMAKPKSVYQVKHPVEVLKHPPPSHFPLESKSSFIPSQSSVPNMTPPRNTLKSNTRQLPYFPPNTRESKPSPPTTQYRSNRPAQPSKSSNPVRPKLDSNKRERDPFHPRLRAFAPPVYISSGCGGGSSR